MPPRRSSKAKAAPVAAPQAEEEPAEAALQTLQFNQPLSWRAGKPIALGELLSRLETLSLELKEMEQEEIERDSLIKVAKELAGQGLLSHKDKGVRAWTACCLVEILRLCAPNAPYTASQLKDIFNFLITSILPAVSDPAHAYNNQHMYALSSLAQVKSIVLVTDLPSSDSLISHLFTSFFDILSGSSKSSTGEQLGKHVEYHMTEILIILVDEALNLPTEVVDIILAQFLRADPRALSAGANKTKKGGATDDKQSTFLIKDLPPAYNMAKQICNSCPEKMARYVSQYFNEAIMDASAGNGLGKGSHRRASLDQADSSEEDIPSGPTEEDLKELNKTHRLIRELWRACPAILQNVIPQLEAELAAENVQLRLLATETLGDMVSGIGAAGPPPPPNTNPAAYPPATLNSSLKSTANQSILTIPASPQPFPQAHPTAYSNFLGRKNDKSTLIRSAWTTSIGRILTTSAGGIGLTQQEEKALVTSLAEKLGDSDERVRVAAVKAVGSFEFRDIIIQLGLIGGVTQPNSVLCNLADRARDRKHGVRIEGMKTLGRIWGVASGEIAAGNEAVISLLSAIPSKLFDTFYTNDMDINVLLDHVQFEMLLPLGYPSLKSKALRNGDADSQKNKDTQGNAEKERDVTEADKIRTERILLLIRDLDPRAKKAFFGMQARQGSYSKIMQTFLKRCEEYNGGVMDDNEATIKTHLGKLIEYFARTLPDPARVAADLWKFAKMHDRRSYQLVRFCMDPASDYKTISNAIKEISKRIDAAPGAPAGLLETLTPLLYRCSLLIYNKSHVPAIMDFSRSDEMGLGNSAHETLKEISINAPEVFKAHVKELCKLLEDQGPCPNKAAASGSLETLKACAGFAVKYPKEIPQDRRFLQSLVRFALHGTPATAKHAVIILMAAAEKKQMYAKDILQKCLGDFQFGVGNFLARLATISQLVLLAPEEVADDMDAIVDLALSDILFRVREPSALPSSDHLWISDDKIDDECKAKLWSLKILVNRLRANKNAELSKETGPLVFKLLFTLIRNEGELTKNENTPPAHKSRLRLLAAQLILKLCRSDHYDELLSPKDFNRLSTVAQDPLFQVRSGFVNKLKKYLTRNFLPRRFETIIFLLAYEPQDELREESVIWIRSRALHCSSSSKTPYMELIFARLISLLAHHPDYGASADDLADFTKYLLFYLNSVATEANIGVIYHIAQRVKQTVDAIDERASENLYHLSDLAQAVIRRYEEVHGWSMQSWPGPKIRLPPALFGAIDGHILASDIAHKNFLPDELTDRLDELVKAKSKSKKRKSEIYEVKEESRKRPKVALAKSKSLPIRKPKIKAGPKTPKKKRSSHDIIPSSERRRSSRSAKVKTYAEDSEEDDGDEYGGDAESQAEDEDEVDEVPEDSDDNNAPEEEEEKERDIKMADIQELPGEGSNGGITKGKNHGDSRNLMPSQQSVGKNLEPPSTGLALSESSDDELSSPKQTPSPPPPIVGKARPKAKRQPDKLLGKPKARVTRSKP
ncbi:MAG: hypothetical protein M1829_001896 [Trizodia sp. TS-e1964]|nr:MAG: hypothetical protein M1829_001896 [Trizodia sp. TS-e1964]